LQAAAVTVAYATGALVSPFNLISLADLLAQVHSNEVDWRECTLQLLKMEPREVNPYLTLFESLLTTASHETLLQSRPLCTRSYSYAIPVPSVLRAIARAAPKVCEIGAGSGYWAKLLAAAGVDVVACDSGEENPDAMGKWFPVQHCTGGQICANNSMDDRALFYCWPRSFDGLQQWHGDTVIVIGEHDNGCTVEFLDRGWALSQRLLLPNWLHVKDDCCVYKKKISTHIEC